MIITIMYHDMYPKNILLWFGILKKKKNMQNHEKIRCYMSKTVLFQYYLLELGQ